MTGERLKREDDRGKPSVAEMLTMAASVVLVGLVLGHLVWQALTLPADGEPQAEIAGMRTLPSGEVEVRVKVSNDAATGVRALEVELDCDDPPPSVEIANIPALGVRHALLHCPAGTSEPGAKIVSVIPT